MGTGSTKKIYCVQPRQHAIDCGATTQISMWTNNPNLNPNIISWFVEMVTGREQTSAHPRSIGDLDTMEAKK